MVYLVIALKSEAQAFVEKYKLIKTKCGSFTLFYNENIVLIISGMGVQNAKNATIRLLESFNIGDSDILVNIGICGASKNYRIGEIVQIGSLWYKDKFYTIDATSPNELTCVDEEITKSGYEMVDMESFGFFEATKLVQNRHIYKVVSDHFEPQNITKDAVKKLLSAVIDEVLKKRLKNEKSSCNRC